MLSSRPPKIKATPRTVPPTDNWLLGGGAMGERIRSMDWSHTSLGALEGWPQDLRAVVNLVLCSSFPMVLLWGSELLFIYNDAYGVLAADKHPKALGRSNREVWPEVWEFQKPIFEGVMARGETVHLADQLFRIARRGCLEDAYFTLSYSPIHTEGGRIGGTLVVLTETTERVVAARQLHESNQALAKQLEERKRVLELARSNKAAAWNRQIEIDAYYQNAPLGLCVIDRHLRYKRINERLAALNGIPVAAHLGRTIHEVLPEIADRIEPLIRRVIETGEPILGMEFEGSNPSRPGELLSCLVNWLPIKDLRGEVSAVAIMVEDITERKRAEEELREREERVTHALQATQEGVWDWNVETNAVFYSPRWKEMLGYSEEEIEPHISAWERLLHPDDNARARQLVDAVLRGEREYEMEFRLQHKDGHYLDILSRGFPIRREPLGSIVRIVGTHFDLTERMQAEEKLRRSEERLRLVLDASAMGTFEIDLVTGEGRWNTTEFELLGLMPGDIPSNPEAFFRYVHPDDIGMVTSKWEEAVRFGKLDVQFRIIRADGEMRWLAGRGRFVFAGKQKGDNTNGCGQALRFLGVNFDITERMQAEDEYKTILRTAMDGFYLVDLEGRILETNDSYCAMIGYSREELRAMSIKDVEAIESEEVIKSRITQILATGQVRFETKHKRKDGRVIEIEASCNFLPQEKERLFVFMRDITKRKLAEESLKAAREELEQRVTERTAELNRANRALRMLNACDEAVARSSSESELLESICQIILEMRGVKMVWVGFAGQDEKKSVRPAAFAGAHPEDMEIAGVTWADEPRGRGPIGTAIRTREVVVCPDVANEPSLTPWRTKQLQHGHASLIALPLVWREDCLGALAISAGQCNAFDAQEVDLLKKAACDLTSGIISQRNRAAHEKLQKELLEISEREKQLISQELHDGLCQNLAGTALMSRMLYTRLEARNDPDAKYAKEIYDLLGTGVNEARNLSHGLHPVGPHGEGLMNALSQLAGTVRNLFHIDCTFECPRGVPLENETASTHLFRITQEAINNARKHGEAERVVIGLHRMDEGEITLTIEDNGVGIPAKRPKKTGMGLRIMNHRAAEIGASLSVRRAGKKGGTVVTCTLPAGSL